MSSVTKRIALTLIIVTSFAGVAYWFYPAETKRKPDIVSISRFDHIFSKDINTATTMADIPALREVSLDGEDIEVRIWRAYDLTTLEGVLVRQIDGQWSGHHFRFGTDEQRNIQAAELEQLKPPASGWLGLWGNLAGKGILLLPLTAENECDTRYLDGIIYVVEISQNNTYRNYQYREGSDGRESKQMTEIGEIIGLEFDSGKEKCKRFEWFACMTDRKARGLTEPE